MQGSSRAVNLGPEEGNLSVHFTEALGGQREVWTNDALPLPGGGHAASPPGPGLYLLQTGLPPPRFPPAPLPTLPFGNQKETTFLH